MGFFFHRFVILISTLKSISCGDSDGAIESNK